VSGSIRRRGKQSWELRFELGRDSATGKRQSRYHSFKGTRRQAQAELTRLTAEALHGTYIDATAGTVGGFLDRWDRDWASIHVSPKTVERYRGLIGKQIIPYIGNRPIQKLRPVDLSELYAKLLREDGLAPRTVGHAHRLLHRAFGHALTWGLIQQNPAAAVHPPRVASQEIEIASEAEIKAVLQYLRDRNRLLYTIATAALATGARRGELCALKWKDFESDGARLRIERSMETTTMTGLRIKSPKTRHG
jgi:integrase